MNRHVQCEQCHKMVGRCYYTRWGLHPDREYPEWAVFMKLKHDVWWCCYACHVAMETMRAPESRKGVRSA